MVCGSKCLRQIVAKGLAIATVSVSFLFAAETQSTAEEKPRYITVGEVSRTPVGWVEFCVEYDPECKTTPSSPRDVELTTQSWKDLQRVNLWVNTHVKPMTDMDHWGVPDRWNYPDDGYGDCEDYVLEKRRMLMKAGFPREALLITVVLDNGDSAAVLTVKTDKGEYILDNRTDAIPLWSYTGYRFIKRQSQSDPNVWVSLSDNHLSTATKSSQ